VYAFEDGLYEDVTSRYKLVSNESLSVNSRDLLILFFSILYGG